MKVAVVSGAGGTLGDDMVFLVIAEWLHEFGVKQVLLNPSLDREYDALIVGGCGIIYDEGVVIGGYENPYRYNTYITDAKRKGIPMIGFGLGWQGLPLESGKDVWVKNIDSFDFSLVWNKQTKDYLKEIGVVSPITATGDLGFALEINPNLGELQFPLSYGLLTHPPKILAQDCHKPEWEEDMNHKLRSVIYSLSKNNSTVIISFCQFFTASLREMSEYSHSPLIEKDHPKQILRIIKGIDVCITTTLHALISAATAGCKILALYPPEPLKPKIRWMAEELGVRSLPFTVSFEEILEGVHKTREDEPPDITKQIKLNKYNKKILQEWVNDIQ